MCTSIYIYIYIRGTVDLSACVYIHIYTHIYTYIHIYIYAYTYTYMYIYVPQGYMGKASFGIHYINIIFLACISCAAAIPVWWLMYPLKLREGEPPAP